MGGLVIADIGGTSARWTLLRPDGSTGTGLRTAGLNLAAADGTDGLHQLQAALLGEQELATAGEVHAYAAGAGSALRAGRIRSLLEACWPEARVHVDTDLTAAARALYGDATGAVLILGTGMNAGLCAQGRITSGIMSLGYILGDEASGADLGRHILTAVLRGHAPAALAAELFPDGIDMDQVVRHLYRGPSPQAWLAALARPLAERRDDPFVQRLVMGRFHALADVLLHELPALRGGELRAMGGIAAAFEAELRQAFLERGVRVNGTSPEAMPGLLRYHRAAAH